MVDQEENITQIDGEPVEILEDDYPNYDLSFKLIVIGDSGVGKSCLTSKATKNIQCNKISNRRRIFIC
jgi:GTPase SAR1 family protein